MIDMVDFAHKVCGIAAAEEAPLKEGDIYFWRWREGAEPRLHGSSQYSYWCKSCKAIVRKGLLLDTYWTDMSSDRAIDPARVVLEYKGNEATLRKIPEWDIPYYEPDDVVDMRHANDARGPVYVKPEAKRSAARILEHLRYVRERNESKISWAQSSIQRIDEEIARVEGGDTDGYFSNPVD